MRFYNFWRRNRILEIKIKSINMSEPLILFHPFTFKILKRFLSDGKWREEIQQKKKLTKMNRPSFSPAIFIFKWSGNNLKKKNYKIYSYFFIIKKNYLNNSG